MQMSLIKREDTKEQTAIYDACADGHDLKVKAYAGTGKTSTFVGVGERMRDKIGLYCAFGKDTQIDAKKRLPPNVMARTFHSLAYQAMDVGKRYGHKLSNYIGVPPKKLEAMLGLQNYEDIGVAAVKETLRLFMYGTDPYLTERNVSSRVLHSIPKADRDEAKKVIARAARKLWFLITDEKRRDVAMIPDAYMKLWHNEGGRLPFKPEAMPHFILADEFQDLNPINLALLERWHGQKMYCGDDHQQIFQFRGSINALGKVDTPVTLCLTQSFRFGEAIAEAANALLEMKGQDLPPLRGNPDRHSDLRWDAPTGRHAILCRTNMGLMDETLALIKAGKTVCVVGNIKDALSMLESAWHLYMNNKNEVKHEAIKLLGDWESLEESAKDSHELKMVMRRIDRYQGGIPSLVKDMREASGVRERDADVVISTAHKAKGLEWDTVKLSDDFPDPMAWDKSEERWKVREDELNLLYVATTRARHVLHGNNVLKLAIASRDFDKAA